jgi:hypothetical protein
MQQAFKSFVTMVISIKTQTMKMKRMNKASLVVALIGLSVWLSSSSCEITGQTVKETRSLSAFNALSLTMSANIYLSQGDQQAVQIEAEKGSLEFIKTEINGNTLAIISKEGHWRSMGDIKIYITVPEIKEIAVSGSGNIVSQTSIHSEDMKINVSGSGNVKIPSLETTAIEVTITGSGNVTLAGKNDQAKLEATITGSGGVKADELSVASAGITISGSGSARVNVLKALETNITGSGSVLYKGSPQINAHSSGSGKTTSL